MFPMMRQVISLTLQKLEFDGDTIASSEVGFVSGWTFEELLLLTMIISSNE